MSELSDKLTHFLCGDESAVEFCNNLIFIAHLWDDLVDNDKERTSADINSAFIWCLVGIQRNVFFVRHSHELLPLMDSAIMQWADANIMEKCTNEDYRILAYMMRNNVMDVIYYCMRLCGGQTWIETEGQNFRRYCAVGLADKFREFKGEKYA